MDMHYQTACIPIVTVIYSAIVSTRRTACWLRNDLAIIKIKHPTIKIPISTRGRHKSVQLTG